MIPIDFETESDVDLSKCGAYCYASHPSTRVRCLAYGDGLWAPGAPDPVELFDHVRNGGLVSGWNAGQFEYLIWNICLPSWPPLKINQIVDTMAAARGWSLPSSLAGAAIACEIPGKIDAGKALARKRHLESWENVSLYQYCMQDVAVESAINQRVPPLSVDEQQVWLVDQRINRRGVAVDTCGIKILQNLFTEIEHSYTKRLQQITAGAITSAGQVAAIAKYCGLPDCTAATVGTALQKDPGNEVLRIRSVLSLSSVKKLNAFLNYVCDDGRIRGMFVYHGASHTGRWAGRGPQPQNLPRTKYDETAVEDVLSVKSLGELEAIGDPMTAISKCIRGMFIGDQLYCSDYHAIEAVVLAVLAGEQWRVELFRGAGNIYEASIARMLGIPIEEATSEQRQRGKVAELASGYGGGLGAWTKFGADKFMSEPEIQAAVTTWRSENPAIVRYWRDTENAFRQAVTGGRSECRGVSWKYSDDVLYARLPSGREMVYHAPRIDTDGLSYMEPTVKAVKWERTRTYGGKLVENIVQGVSRDILAAALVRVEDNGWPVVMHVHDEIVCEKARGDLAEMEQIMSVMPAWAKNWPVYATGGWTGRRYKK